MPKWNMDGQVEIKNCNIQKLETYAESVDYQKLIGKIKEPDFSNRADQ